MFEVYQPRGWRRIIEVGVGLKSRLQAYWDRLMADEQVRATAYHVSIFVFVAIMGLLAIFAAAERKGEPINAFVETLGVAAQALIAFVVWRLSVRQFAYSQNAAERQARIDALASRREAFDQWRAFTAIASPSPSDEKLHQLLDCQAIIDVVFPDHINILVDQYTETYIQLIDADEAVTAAKIDDLTDDQYEAAVKELRSAQKVSRAEIMKVTRALREAMRLEIPF